MAVRHRSNVADHSMDAPGLRSLSRHDGDVACGRLVHGDRGAAKAVGDVGREWPAARRDVGGGGGGGAGVELRSPLPGLGWTGAGPLKPPTPPPTERPLVPGQAVIQYCTNIVLLYNIVLYHVVQHNTVYQNNINTILTTEKHIVQCTIYNRIQ